MGSLDTAHAIEKRAAYEKGLAEGRAEVEARMAAAASMLSDNAAYRVMRMLSTEERHPCPAETCTLNAEEHHLLAYGILAENRELKRRIQEFEHGKKEVTDGD